MISLSYFFISTVMVSAFLSLFLLCEDGPLKYISIITVDIPCSVHFHWHLRANSIGCDGWHNVCRKIQVRARRLQRSVFRLHLRVNMILQILKQNSLFIINDTLYCSRCNLLIGQMQASCYSIRFGGSLVGAIIGGYSLSRPLKSLALSPPLPPWPTLHPN